MMRRGAAHHVALNVAAGGQRRELDGVDPPNGGLQIVLQDAVELQPLAAGNPQGCMPTSSQQIEFGQKAARWGSASRPESWCGPMKVNDVAVLAPAVRPAAPRRDRLLMSRSQVERVFAEVGSFAVDQFLAMSRAGMLSVF